MYISPVIEMDKGTFNKFTQLLICYKIFITLRNANFSTLLLRFAFENTSGKQAILSPVDTERQIGLVA
jgi:hypothetical protein